MYKIVISSNSGLHGNCMMIGGLLKPGRRRQQDCFETKFDVTRAAFQGRFLKMLFHGTTCNNNLSMFREKIKLPKRF